MMLIVGGAGSGKRAYALSLGYGEEDISGSPADACPVLYGLEAIVADAPGDADGLLPLLLKKKIVICREVGSGVIPVERETRICREATGRLCVLLAQRAETVIRMVCGIPTTIKREEA